MLLKVDAFALHRRYQAVLSRYMRVMRQGARASEMYSIFPYFENAFDCIHDENLFRIPNNGTENKAIKILGDSNTPLVVIENFVRHYSPTEFSTLVQEDVHDQQLLAQLNAFYDELTQLCKPGPTILYKGKYHNELAIKFPTKEVHDNFVSMIEASVGTTYSNNLSVLFIPGRVEDEHLIATFPSKALREQVINLLDLTGATVRRKDDNELVVNDPVILQALQNISIKTPEHLYDAERKKAYKNFQVVAKGFGSYVHCPQSFFNALPLDVNKQIASSLANVLEIELNPETSDRVASTYI